MQAVTGKENNTFLKEVWGFFSFSFSLFNGASTK